MHFDFLLVRNSVMLVGIKLYEPSTGLMFCIYTRDTTLFTKKLHLTVLSIGIFSSRICRITSSDTASCQLGYRLESIRIIV